MSTRSIIAVARGDGWEGVYCHMDGYPSGVGAQVWNGIEMLRLEYEPGDLVKEFSWRYITQHAYTYGYSQFNVNPFLCVRCEYEHGESASATRWASFNEHETNNALMIEWVYVISNTCLSIFTHARAEWNILHTNNGHTWEEPRYQWVLVTQCVYEHGEPDWEVIEAQGQRIHQDYREKYHHI